MSEATSYTSSPPHVFIALTRIALFYFTLLYSTLPLPLFVQCIKYEKNGVQLPANNFCKCERMPAENTLKSLSA